MSATNYPPGTTSSDLDAFEDDGTIPDTCPGCGEYDHFPIIETTNRGWILHDEGCGEKWEFEPDVGL